MATPEDVDVLENRVRTGYWYRWLRVHLPSIYADIAWLIARARAAEEVKRG